MPEEDLQFSITLSSKKDTEKAEARISVSGTTDQNQISDLGVVTAAYALAYAYVTWFNQQDVLADTYTVRKTLTYTFCDKINAIFDMCIQQVKNEMESA